MYVGSVRVCVFRVDKRLSLFINKLCLTGERFEVTDTVIVSSIHPQIIILL